MKSIVIISIIILIFSFFQVYIVMAGNKTETQTYRVVQENEKFEIESEQKTTTNTRQFILAILRITKKRNCPRNSGLLIT